MYANREAVRSFEVKVRLSVSEWKKLRALAEERGESMAAVVRALALESARESAAQTNDIASKAA